MPASPYLANAILDLTLRGVPFVPPVRVFISLHTADPGPEAANEVTPEQWPAYARIDPAKGGAVDAGFAEAADKKTSNALDLAWAAMNAAGPVDVTHFGIWTAATGGNMLVYGALKDVKRMTNTDELLLRSGTLDVNVI